MNTFDPRECACVLKFFIIIIIIIHRSLCHFPLRQIDKWLKRQPEEKVRRSGFMEFCCARHPQQGDINGNTEISEDSGRPAWCSVLETEWRGLDPRQKHK